MCNEIKCTIQYIVDLINNNANNIQNEMLNRGVYKEMLVKMTGCYIMYFPNAHFVFTIGVTTVQYLFHLNYIN